MIVRTKKNQDYSVINNTVLKDKRLSWRARGIAAYLLTMPDDWSINSNHLWKSGTEGRDAVRNAMKELEESGYLIRTKYQTKDGKWNTELVLGESPTPGKPTPGKPTPDFQALYKDTNNQILRTDCANAHEDAALRLRTESPSAHRSPVQENLFDTDSDQEPEEDTPSSPPIPPAPSSPSPARKGKATPEQAALMNTYKALIEEDEGLRAVSTLRYQVEWVGIKRMAAAGYTPDEMSSAYRVMRADAWWRGKHIPAQTLASQMGALLAQVQPQVTTLEFEW